MIARYRPWPEVLVRDHEPGDWTWAKAGRRHSDEIIGVWGLTPAGQTFICIDWLSHPDPKMRTVECSGYFSGDETTITARGTITPTGWELDCGRWVSEG